MNAGEIIQGRYRLEQALGKGGMATVWRAHDLRLERPVALKCLTAPLSEDPEFLVRFFAEAQQVARLSHPNVVRVLDFGQGDACPYLVMEYVPGGSLNDVIGTPIEPDRAIEIVAGAARGAGAAHAAGMVHRDLKPGNILLADDGTPKLADFGIAVSQAQERLTATGTAIGSPHYVSPEQASGRPIGAPSDVYSLGVVLYELLTGRRPFEKDNVTALAIAHVEEEPEPPSAHKPELPASVDEFVLTCLAKEPAARFPDGAAMAAALDRLGTDGATAAFAPAAAATSAATIMAAAATEDADDIVEEPRAARNGRRVASVALLAALFLGLLVFGIMALGDDGGRNEEKAVADTKVDQEGSINAKESPEASEEEDTADAPVTVDDTSEETPAATTSPEPTEDPDEDTKKTAKNSSSDDTTEEEQPVSEPTAEPTSDPTSAPTSEPTSTP